MVNIGIPCIQKLRLAYMLLLTKEKEKRVKYIILIPQINFMIRWDYDQAWIGLIFMPWYGMIYMY